MVEEAMNISGLASLSFIMIATSDPCGLLTLLFTHKDYRTAIIQFSSNKHPNSIILSSRKNLDEV